MKTLLIALMMFGISLHSHADKIVLLDDVKESLQARADYILNAKETIRAQYFTIDSDHLSRTALALILNAVNNNPQLKVKILVDSMHNLMLRETMSAVLGNNHPERAKNIEIREYNTFNLFHPFRYTKRMHDKGLIIDGKYMISGGRNIANGYYGMSNQQHGLAQPVFEDSDALVLDSPAIDVASKYFDDLWNSKFVSKLNLYDYSAEELSGENCNRNTDRDFWQCEAQRKYRLKKVKKEEDGLLSLIRDYNENKLHIQHDPLDWAARGIEVSNIDFLFDNPVGQKSNLKKPDNNIGVQLYSAISKAESSVVILTPYLIITPEQTALFKTLRDKNVEVTIITNSKGACDVPAAWLGYEKTRHLALDLGVKIFEYQGPDTLHAKMVLIDRATIFIGSFNWDFRSQNLNREVGILAQLPDDKENDFSTNLITKFAKILKKSCKVGASICNADYNQNLESLSQDEVDDLMIAFKLREQNKATLYRIFFPILKGQL